MGRERWHVFLLCAAILVLGACGCHNTCVSGVLNSPGSTINVKIGSPQPTCTLSQATGVVQIGIGAAATAETGPNGAQGEEPTDSGTASAQIAHLYVTLAGIDAHASPEADDRATDWQPLAPQLAAQPLQVDLVAPARGEGAPAPMQEAVVPAGVYRQVRLRLAMLRSARDSLVETTESVLETSRCGADVLHCAVTSDGRMRPLASMLDLRVSPEGMGGRWLTVPPDGAVTMVIELDKERSFLWPTGEGLRPRAQFRVRFEEPGEK